MCRRANLREAETIWRPLTGLNRETLAVSTSSSLHDTHTGAGAGAVDAVRAVSLRCGRTMPYPDVLTSLELSPS